VHCAVLVKRHGVWEYWELHSRVKNSPQFSELTATLFPQFKIIWYCLSQVLVSSHLSACSCWLVWLSIDIHPLIQVLYSPSVIFHMPENSLHQGLFIQALGFNIRALSNLVHICVRQSSVIIMCHWWTITLCRAGMCAS